MPRAARTRITQLQCRLVCLQLRIVPMLPTDAEALVAQYDFDGVTVFAAGVMRPGMGLEDLAQLAFGGLRGERAA